MYLVLKFDNAKLYRNKNLKEAKSNPSKSHFMNGPLEDRVHKGFKEPITVYQISNIVHVLFGERPVPTMRESISSIHQPYFDKAKKSFLKYTSMISFVDKRGNIKSISQFVSTNKALDNSNLLSTVYSWRDIEYFLMKLDPNYLVDLDTMVKNYGLDKKKYTFNKFLNKVYELGDFVPLYTFLNNIFDKKRQVKTLYNDITGYYQINFDFPKTGSLKFHGYEFKNLRSYNGAEMRTTKDVKIGGRITNGIASYENYYGFIYIPITTEDIPLLEENVGIATLLDGGLVTIYDVIEDIDVFERENLLNVGDISLEEINY